MEDSAKTNWRTMSDYDWMSALRERGPNLLFLSEGPEIWIPVCRQSQDLKTIVSKKKDPGISPRTSKTILQTQQQASQLPVQLSLEL